jgi:nucleoside phosphorylase
MDWFDPSRDAVVEAGEQWRRECQRRFGTDALPIAAHLLFANNNRKGRLFEAASAVLDVTAVVVHDARASGYVHYRLPVGPPLTLYRAVEPAPYAAAHLDVLMSVGARSVLYLNGAGSVRADVPVGSVVLPTDLVREEGTSFHYAPADVVLRTSDRLRRQLTATAEHLGVPIIQGAHWTTDAIYRETVGKVARLAAAGVVSLDMELSALAGVAHFHGGDLAAVHVVTDVVAKPHTWTGTESAAFHAGVHAAARLASVALLQAAEG